VTLTVDLLTLDAHHYAPPLIGGDIKRCFCLTSVCLTSVAYIGPKLRKERHRMTKISTEVAHVTRDSDTTFKVKRSKVKVTRPLCWPRTREAGAAVTVRTYWAWETTDTLRLLGGARGAGAPTGGGEGRGHIVSPRAQLVYQVSILRQLRILYDHAAVPRDL